MGHDGLKMLPPPIHTVIDSDLTDFLRIFKKNRNGYPLPTLMCFDPVSILPFVFFILDIVEQTEDIRLPDFVKIA